MITLNNLKRFATLQARAALAGITFHRLEGDFGHLVYVATRGAMTCHFDDLDDVADWLDGVPAVISAGDDGDANWNGGMSYNKYLGSAETQDAAFKTNSDSAYASMMKKGMITASTPPEQVAGLLKARHLSGMGGANAVAKGGTGPADANGTTPRKYYEDVAGDKNGFLSAYSGKTATVGTAQAVQPVSVPPSVPARLPVSPEVAIPPPSGLDNGKAVATAAREPIGQNMADRQIAHIVSGGIGATGRW